MSLRRTSKDLNSSFFLPSALRQDLNKNQKFLPKNSSQKLPPKNFLEKKFLQNNPPQKFSKNYKRTTRKFQTISQKFYDFENPIPYIALRGQKPFRACFFL